MRSRAGLFNPDRSCKRARERWKVSLIDTEAPTEPRPRLSLNTEDQQDGEESKKAQIFKGCGEGGKPRHEEAQIRYAEERPIRQEGKEQETGDRDRLV
jgi:hypothetical protein